MKLTIAKLISRRIWNDRLFCALSRDLSKTIMEEVLIFVSPITKLFNLLTLMGPL